MKEVITLCDIHDSLGSRALADGEEPVKYTFDGVKYEFDACDEHRFEFEQAMAPFVKASRSTRHAPAAEAEPTRKRGQAAGKPKVPCMVCGDEKVMGAAMTRHVHQYHPDSLSVYLASIGRTKVANHR